MVIEVRSDEAWAQGRVAMASTCNAGVKGAPEFAELGYSVREIIGGFEYWARGGYPAEDADGIHRRSIDPLAGVPRIRTRA